MSANENNLKLDDPVAAGDSLAVPEQLLKGWQAALDSTAEILEVPVALVMRIVGLRIEVFISSNTPANPYKPGESERLLDSGLYCESVTRNLEALEVADARLSARWRTNPDMKFGLLAYLGYPVMLPDGRVFGTVCVLDRQPRRFTDPQRRLVATVRKLIEGQLSLLRPDSYGPSGAGDAGHRAHPAAAPLHRVAPGGRRWCHGRHLPEGHRGQLPVVQPGRGDLHQPRSGRRHRQNRG
jgi:hypothetical protein